MARKLIIFIVSLFVVLNLNIVASEEASLLPKKKPKLTEKELKKKILINILKPVPKPILVIKETPAKEIVKNFFEIIIAPDFDKKSLLILKSKKNLRIVKAKFKNSEDLFFRSISGGLLAQSQNINENYDLNIVTERKPDSVQLVDLKFAWNLCLFIKSLLFLQ